MHNSTLSEQSKALQSGAISSLELTQLYLDRITRFNKKYNCYITVTQDSAIQQAKDADMRRSANKEVSPLTGIPVTHKDNLLTENVKTTCASKMLHDFCAPYESTVTQKLKNAGTILLGKSNMDEFAMGSSSETSYYGSVKNPWDTDRVPGGSSGGSACAVAAGLASAATGSDTGGSIRQPAAFCGVTGLKPSYGRLSRWGLVAFASSLDQAGPIARSAEDIALLMNVMSGHDSRDSTCSTLPVPDFCSDLNSSLRGKKIGIATRWIESCNTQIAKQLNAAIEIYKSMGAQIIEIDLQHTQSAISSYYVLASAEAASNLSRFDGIRYGYRCDNPENLEDLYVRSRTEGFGDEVKRRIMVGNYTLSAGYYDAYYIKAQKVRRLIQNEFQQVLKNVDVIVAPVTPDVAFGLGEKTQSPAAMYQSDIFTVGVNLAGLPAISVPVGFAGHLPVGMQIIGNHFAEAALLNFANRYQQETGWHKKVPGSLS